jgi:hypothetical protein
MRPFIVLLFGTMAVAQTNSPNRVVVSGSFAGSTGFIGGGKLIAGAPYSALEVSDNVQTLADGTHITQPSAKTMHYRDSQGRTRIERTFVPPPGVSNTEDTGPSMIEINDPVDGVQYTLTPRDHKARKVSTTPAGIATTVPPAPPNGTPLGSVANSRWYVANGDRAATNDQRQRPEISTESLGTQTIEGVTAEVSRTTVTYPVNFFGNDRPITTVSETWTSPDLKLTVLSKNSDPRSGEHTTRLTNISRAEPDPTLFQVPPDYEIVDAATPRVSH